MSKEKPETKAKPEFEERQPVLSRKIKMSKDKNWIIIQTIRTDILHTNYLKKIME